MKFTAASFLSDTGRSFFLDPESLKAWMEITPGDMRQLSKDLFDTANKSDCMAQVDVEDETIQVIDLDFFAHYFRDNLEVGKQIETIKNNMIIKLDKKYFN